MIAHTLGHILHLAPDTYIHGVDSKSNCNARTTSRSDALSRNKLPALFSQWGTDYRNSLTAIYHHRIRVFLLFSHTLAPYSITHQFAPSSTLRQPKSPLASFQRPLNDFLTQPNSQTMKLSSNQRAPAPRKKSRIRDP
jgi:hypothetical protein